MHKGKLKIIVQEYWAQKKNILASNADTLHTIESNPLSDQSIIVKYQNLIYLTTT